MKLLIFDMDNCLFQTFKDGVATCANQSVEDVLDVIPNIDKRKVRRILYKFGVESVIKMFEVDSNVATKMREKWKELVASNIQPFEDVAVLSELKIPKVLVTTGMVHFQNSKINKLGIRDMFDEVIINSTDGLNELPSKKPIFEKIMQKYNLHGSEIMVIGDKWNDELKSGKELGMITVQTHRPGVEKGEADYHVTSLRDLPLS